MRVCLFYYACIELQSGKKVNEKEKRFLASCCRYLEHCDSQMNFLLPTCIFNRAIEHVSHVILKMRMKITYSKNIC